MSYDDFTDEEDFEDLEEEETLRRSLPRFGPFVTIAAAILILFGAASQVGKTTTTGLLSTLDISANQLAESAQSRRDEGLAGVLITIGNRHAVSPAGQGQGSVRLEEHPVTPYRHAGQAPAGAVESLPYDTPDYPPLPEGRREPPVDYERFDPAPEAAPRQTSGPKTHVVATGENWMKIQKATGKRWQDIRRANPESKDGLRVGMRLVIPD